MKGSAKPLLSHITVHRPSKAIKLLIDDYLGPSVIGQNPAALEAILLTMDKIVKDNAYAKGVVEMACVDLTARSFGVSAAALFGGAVRERIPTLWVLGTGDAAKDIAEAEEKMAAGLYKLFLVKVGKGDPRDDVARAAAVKQALGDRRAYTSTSIRVGMRPRQFGRLNGCRTLVSPLSSSHCLARISKGCGG